MRQRILKSIGRAIIRLFLGLWLLLRDAHRLLYRRFNNRVWWFYIGAAFILMLLLTGNLGRFLVLILSLIIVVLLLRWLLRKTFGGKK